MRTTTVAILLLLSCAPMAACSSANDAGGSPAAPADASPADATSDASLDAAADVSADSFPDGPLPDGIPLFEGSTDDHVSPDAAPDASIDASEVPDSSSPEAGPEPQPEAGPEPQPEAGPEPQPEAGPEPQPEAGPDAPSWPVGAGVYSYSRIATYDLVNPAAVAWHPSGSYALVLDGYDEVYRFDPATQALAKVASLGANVRWRGLSFSPDGAKAILLGNDTAANEGILFLWDHATSSAAEMAGQRYAGGTYEALEYSPDGASARLLGSRKGTGYIATVWVFDVSAGRSNPLATATSAGCQDIAWATDVYNAPAIAVVCGENGAQLLHIDGGNNYVVHTLNAGNTSRVSGRPQGDYALGVCWSSSPGKVYHFQQGQWNSDYGSPGKLGIFQIEFSSDGLRALLLGGYGGNPAVGQVYEYRHDLLVTSQILDVSIPNFASPPYNADTYVELNDAAWRPGCDGGLIVGGSNTWNSKTGYVIRFSVDNGITCPN